jgi:hypothetical protein
LKNLIFKDFNIQRLKQFMCESFADFDAWNRICRGIFLGTRRFESGLLRIGVSVVWHIL